MVHSKKGLTSVSLAFDEALNPASANNLGLYRVLGAVKKRGKTVYSKALKISRVSFDGNAHVTITLAKPYKGAVQVTVFGGMKASSGVSSESASMIVVR